jgi:hypothetical protein
MIRYSFDRQSGGCITFSYSGCQGNQNNFVSKSSCEDTCIGHRYPSKQLISFNVPDVLFLFFISPLEYIPKNPRQFKRSLFNKIRNFGH